MEEEINLEEILLNKYYETKKNWNLPPIDLRYKQTVLDDMKESCRQTLELAADNAKAEIICGYEGDEPYAIVDKHSILNTINQIK